MTTYTDNLDGTASDLLSSRSGWTRPVGSDPARINDAGSGLALTNGTTAGSGTWHVPDDQPSGNDQIMGGYLKTGPASGGCRPLCVRADTSSATGAAYTARRNSSNQIIVHRRASGGTFTQIGSYTVTPSSDFTTKRVDLEAVGNQITVYLDGTAVVGPITDNNIASGSVAILTLGGTLTSTDNLLDDVEWGDAGAASGAITGSASPAFTASGVLQATGALAGVSSFAVTASGAIAATGALSGASSLVSTGSGTLHNDSAMPGALSGAASVAISASGTLAGACAMAGVATVANSASGNVIGVGALRGAATVAVACTATGSATALLSGASTLAIAAAGTVQGLAGLSGAASIDLSGAGILRGSGAMMGTSSIAFTAAAITAGNDDDQYPLAGQSQGLPLAGLTQGSPLAGLSQQYPLYGRAA